MSRIPTESHSGWIMLARSALFMLGCAVVLATAAPLAKPPSALSPEIVVGSVASVGAFVLTVLFVGWDRTRLEDVGAAPDRRTPLRLGLGFLTGLFLVALSTALTATVVPTRWTLTSAVGFGASLLQLLGFLALSCREELAFHGYPLRRVSKVVGLLSGQIIIALAFGLEHRIGGWTWTQALLGASVGSLAFGMAAIATRGLAVPIGLHAAWNFGQWVLGQKAEVGVWQQVTEDSDRSRAAVAGSIGYIAVMSLATIAFWLWYRAAERARAKPPEIPPQRRHPPTVQG